MAIAATIASAIQIVRLVFIDTFGSCDNAAFTDVHCWAPGPDRSLYAGGL